MAYSSTALTAKQIADYNSDYPILVGNNAFDFQHLSSGLWTDTSGASADSTDTDTTNASFPFYNAAGREPSTLSKTSGTGAYHWMHFDPVGTFVSECVVTGSSVTVTPDASGDLDSIRAGMFVADDGTGRFIVRGAKVASVGGSTFTLDVAAIATDAANDLIFTGKPEADKAIVDSFFVFNHNMNTAATTDCAWRFYVRNYQEHSGTIVGSATQANAKPIVAILLDDSGGGGATPRKYANVEAASLRLHTPGISSTTGYYAGSVWAGERWQLPRWPNKPYDDKGTHSGASDHIGSSGFSTRQSTWKGRAFRRWSIPLSSDEDVAGCKLFQRGCGYFTKPFVLVENPKTDPKAYVMQAESAAVVFPRTGKHERVFNITMIEKPPFYSTY